MLFNQTRDAWLTLCEICVYYHGLSSRTEAELIEGGYPSDADPSGGGGGGPDGDPSASSASSAASPTPPAQRTHTNRVWPGRLIVVEESAIPDFRLGSSGAGPNAAGLDEVDSDHENMFVGVPLNKEAPRDAQHIRESIVNEIQRFQEGSQRPSSPSASVSGASEGEEENRNGIRDGVRKLFFSPGPLVSSPLSPLAATSSPPFPPSRGTSPIPPQSSSPPLTPLLPPRPGATGAANDPIPWNPKGGDVVSEFTTEAYYVKIAPWLFVGQNKAEGLGFGDMTIPRRVKVNETEWNRYLSKYWDGRFVHDEVFDFIRFNRKLRSRVATAVNVVVSKEGLENFTVADLEEMLRQNDASLLRRALTYTSSIPCSPAYWKNFLMKLKALSDFAKYGSLCWFFTASAADYEWHDLFKLIAQQHGDLTDDELGPGDSFATDAPFKAKRYKAAINNPHLNTWYFSRRFEIFLKNVLVPMLGLTEYIYRYEYQTDRDADHVHGAATSDLAPGMDAFHQGDLMLTKFAAARNAVTRETDTPDPKLLAEMDNAISVEYTEGLKEFLDWMWIHVPLHAILNGYNDLFNEPRAVKTNVMARDMRYEAFDAIIEARPRRAMHALVHGHRRYCLSKIRQKFPSIAFDPNTGGPIDHRERNLLNSHNLYCRFFLIYFFDFSFFIFYAFADFIFQWTFFPWNIFF